MQSKHEYLQVEPGDLSCSADSNGVVPFDSLTGAILSNLDDIKVKDTGVKEVDDDEYVKVTYDDAAHYNAEHDDAEDVDAAYIDVEDEKLNENAPRTPKDDPAAHLLNETFVGEMLADAPDLDEPEGRDTSLLTQVIVAPITQAQLLIELQGIYAGLVMVEQRCIDIIQENQTVQKLSREQWQALIALFRTLIHEHHNFFLASQHPSASLQMKKLPSKYKMPARLWCTGIHLFLEFLRHRLPDSWDYMSAFIHLAYSMITLLMESIPSFLQVWIECLGGLARYRMGIEVDVDRIIWLGVARMWYNQAADYSPNLGRLQHHLAVLSQNIQQLYYYSKALISILPFTPTCESILLFFNPFLENITSQPNIRLEHAFITANAICLTKGSIDRYIYFMGHVTTNLDGYIDQNSTAFRIKGPEIASSLIAATMGFGFNNIIFRHLQKQKHLTDLEQSFSSKLKKPSNFFPLIQNNTFLKDNTFNRENSSIFTFQMLGKITNIICQRTEDNNVLPYMHLYLAFLLSLARIDALQSIESHIPWGNLANFLNKLKRTGIGEAQIEGPEFSKLSSNIRQQLPEDFIMRGVVWVHNYLPKDFFDDIIVEDERTLELPCHTITRIGRCLYISRQLTMYGKWFKYHYIEKKFTVGSQGLGIYAKPFEEIF